MKSFGKDRGREFELYIEKNAEITEEPRQTNDSAEKINKAPVSSESESERGEKQIEIERERGGGGGRRKVLFWFDVWLQLGNRANGSITRSCSILQLTVRSPSL